MQGTMYFLWRFVMAMLQVRDMDDRLYEKLKFSAKLDNRSISQQVITILQDYFTSVPVKSKNATEEFLKLAGTWEDSRSTEEIIDDVYASRVNSTRFEALDGIFD
jgi:plasmid stability protein